MPRIRPQKYNTQTNKLTILRTVKILEIYFLFLCCGLVLRGLYFQTYRKQIPLKYSQLLLVKLFIYLVKEVKLILVHIILHFELVINCTEKSDKQRIWTFSVQQMLPRKYNCLTCQGSKQLSHNRLLVELRLSHISFNICHCRNKFTDEIFDLICLLFLRWVKFWLKITASWIF